MNDQRKFEEASENERMLMTKLLTDRGVKYFEFTSIEGTDRFDGCFTGHTGNEVVFEVKTRNYPASHKDYSTVIEQSKLDYILNKSKGTQHHPYLFFFFNDNTCWIEKLDHDQYYSSFFAKAPSTTMGNNSSRLKQFVAFQIDRNKLLYLI